ncbi:hypothetical protein YC2023_065305 [Brassica napus]
MRKKALWGKGESVYVFLVRPKVAENLMSKGLTTMKEEKEELFNSKDRFPASAKGGKSLICSLQLSNIGYLDLLAGDIRIDFFRPREARSLGRSKPIPGHCVSPEQLAEKKKLEREPQGILSSRHLGKYFHSNELKETNRKQQDTLRHILGIDEITRPKREVQHNENEKYVRAKSCMRITTPGNGNKRKERKYVKEIRCRNGLSKSKETSKLSATCTRRLYSSTYAFSLLQDVLTIFPM